MGKSQAKDVLITPPDTLRRKVGGRLAPVNEAAIAKAEAALKDLSRDFDKWIVEEVCKLEEARSNVANDGLGSEAGKQLFNCAHDLKGLGTTYGYPFVSAIADSLCKITLDAKIRGKAPFELVSAHVDSIRAVVRGHIKVDNHPVGTALVQELTQRSSAFLARF